MSRSGQLWRLLIYILLAHLPLQMLHAQHPVKLRSVVNNGGQSQTFSIQNHEYLGQQSIGEPGAIGPNKAGTFLLRQGFIQPPGHPDAKIAPGDPLLTVAPNPFSSGINVSLSDTISGDLFITLYDIYGKSIYNNRLMATGEFFLDFSMFSPGLYILKVRTGPGYYVAKLIKE
jgi:hypothetical protein